MSPQRSRALFAAAAAIALLFALAPRSEQARAHVGALPVALITGPQGASTVVEDSFTFQWFDTNRPAMTGTATIDFYYTRDIPPTFGQGYIPPALTGTAIVTGVLETDTANEHTWDTRNVPTGTYWLWSIIREPPMELNRIDIVTFSPGTVTVHHPPDPMPLSVVITKPDSPFRWAEDDRFDIHFSALDPDGTGRVKLEAFSKDDQSDVTVIAEDLPTSPGIYTWNTAALPEADYTLRATITDARGERFVSYARYYVLVAHIIAPDAGVRPDAAPPPDSGPAPDAGLADAAATSGGGGGGCTCTPGRSTAAWLLLPLLFYATRTPALRSKRRRPARGE